MPRRCFNDPSGAGASGGERAAIWAGMGVGFPGRRLRHIPVRCAPILLLLASPLTAFSQATWEYGGFFQTAAQFYTRRPNPSDTHAAANGRLQLWTRAVIGNRFSWRAKYDFRLDTHRDVERGRWFDVSQRGLLQPAGSLTEFYADVKLGRVDLRMGQQQIRWGRADGWNPTDNLIPYDYLNTFADERIAVPALKADAYAGRARFEAAWIPFYTPTRLPLIGQRWFPRLPTSAKIVLAPGTDPVEASVSYRDGGGPLPARTLGNSQWAVRWNQLVRRGEFSLSYFDGFDDLAFFRPSFSPAVLRAGTPPHLLVLLNREYHRVRVAGADFASALGPVGIRGELAYFDQTDPSNLDHLLFIVGVDRTWGDWFAIVQYAGQKVSRSLQTSAVFPDLGLRSTLLCRIERTLGPSRSFEVKGALRLLDGDFLVQPVYSVALTNKWRFKIGATIFAGPRDSYLGQFRDSGYLNLELRYTF